LCKNGGKKSMAIRKEKKDKIIVRPEEKGEISTRRPFDLWSDMDRIFDDFRSNFEDLFWPWDRTRGPLTTIREYRTPPMNVEDMGDYYRMRIEMPGIKKDEIAIQVTPYSIEIKSEKSDSKEEKDKNWLCRECSTTSFYRSLELPEELITDNVEAELKDGVLTVNLPKAEPEPEFKAKKIQIK
jgi:HSP20 family protein